MRRLSPSYSSVGAQAKASRYVTHLRLTQWAALGLCATLFLLSACSPSSGATGGNGGGAPTTSTNTTPAATKPVLGSDIAAQLKAASPQDATYTFEQSDAKFKSGSKLGEGLETKTPDLTYQKWTSPQTEQVIDYANAAFYQRQGDGKWGRSSQKIAHYYDLHDAKVLGTETVNGVTAYHIRGTAINNDQSFTMDVWARTDNLYPAQIWEAYGDGSQATYYLFVMTAYNTGAKVTIPSV